MRALVLALTICAAMAVTVHAQDRYIGGTGLVGPAALTDWSVEVHGDAWIVRGVVENRSDVALAGVEVTLWANESTTVDLGMIKPGEFRAFTAEVAPSPVNVSITGELLPLISVAP